MSPPTPTDSEDRRRAAVHGAMATSSIWLLPLAGLTAVVAYFLLVFSDFMAEGLNGEVTATTYLITLGLPALAFALAAVAGLAAAWSLARWTSRLALLARVYPWLLGAIAALVGALIAATVFYATFARANWLASR